MAKKSTSKKPTVRRARDPLAFVVLFNGVEFFRTDTLSHARARILTMAPAKLDGFSVQTVVGKAAVFKFVGNDLVQV